MKTSYLKERQPIKISVEGGLTEDSSIQLTMSSFATIEEWIETFRTILVHQGFQFDTISQLFDEEECVSCNDKSSPQFLQEEEDF
jgi:hypothetical protein